MTEQGTVVLDFDKCSPDLNPIECAWREVRARLATTEPQAMEDRGAFINRLRLAVAWVNKNRAGLLRELCVNQKGWAHDVLAAKGARTKH